MTGKLVTRVEGKKNVNAANHDEQENDAEKVGNRDCIKLEQPVGFICVLFLK